MDRAFVRKKKNWGRGRFWNFSSVLLLKAFGLHLNTEEPHQSASSRVSGALYSCVTLPEIQ